MILRCAKYNAGHELLGAEQHMGTWGTGLYQDDTTCEVRDAFIKNLKEGLSDSAAGQKILKGYGNTLRLRQVACAVYFALAETQWQYGRVDAAIRQRALDLIRKGADLKTWKEDAPDLVKARLKVLDNLKALLSSKPKARREVKVQRPKAPRKWTDAKLGTVFLLPLSKTTFGALVLLGNRDTGLKSLDPSFGVLKWKGRRAPTLAQLRGRQFVRVPEGAKPGCDSHREIGFITLEKNQNPLEGLIETAVVLPKPPRSTGGFFTGKARLTELIAAAIAGRRPPPDEWDLKFGFLAKKNQKT
jgi:hypothetical protein